MDTRLRLFGLVIALTVIFHHTFGRFQFGYSFDLFIIAYLIAFHLAVLWQHRITNRWAYLFLAPVAAGLYGEAMYAADITRLLAFVITPICLAFFSYWSTAPAQSLKALFSLTPATLAADTVVPFKDYREHFAVRTSIKGQHVWQIALGVGMGLPILWIVTALFASADQNFAQLLEVLTSWNILPSEGGRLFLDLLFGLFLVGFIGTIVRRRHATPSTETPPNPEPVFKDRLALHTFLVLLNTIFAVFVVIQVLYVIQGAGHWQTTGLTFADYAKQSFYQLFAVAMIVFGVAYASYRRAGTHVFLTRFLLLTLITQTGVVIASAGTRLALYISTYNLTVARWFGAIELFAIACLLLWCAIAIARRLPILRFMQGTILGATVFAVPLLVLDHEGLVANYNVHRFVSNMTTRLDTAYLKNLSSDAVPALITLYTADWSTPVSFCPMLDTAVTQGSKQRACLGDTLKNKRNVLQMNTEDDWRLLVRSDRRALERIRLLQL